MKNNTLADTVVKVGVRLDFDRDSVLTNCGQRDISGTYQPYECAVFKLNK